jgi:hypothetical protein
VPPDHLVRQIDGMLDLNWVYKQLSQYYSHTGRPSIDPVLMIRMLVVGYVFAIRSERRALRCRSIRPTGGFANSVSRTRSLIIRWASSTEAATCHIERACLIVRGATSSRSVRRQTTRKVSRDIDEDIQDQVRVLANTEAF